MDFAAFYVYMTGSRIDLESHNAYISVTETVIYFYLHQITFQADNQVHKLFVLYSTSIDIENEGADFKINNWLCLVFK